MFNFPLVYIGDFATLKQVFNHPDAQGRSLPRMREVFKEQRRSTFLPGIIFSPVEAWSEQRRFTLRALKDFGFGQTGMESIIVEELAQFTAHMKSFAGKLTDIRAVFMLPLINILWRVMSSQQFEYDNPQMIELLKHVTYLFQYDSSAEFKISLAWPWLAKLGPVRKLLKKDEWLAANYRVLDMMRASIEDHEKTMDMDAPRDFIDMALIESSQTKDEKSSFFGEVGRTNLANILFDLFLAGGETSSTTLAWAVLFMVRNPRVQDRVQAELEQVLGGRGPRLHDRPHLPFTEATIMEVQRVANIAPQGLTHVSDKDLLVNGFTVPANTMIVGLYAEILKGSHWQDGRAFRPDRFLDTQGQVVRDPQFIPFSIGKKQCLGEGLAKAELFLFFSTLMQAFRFSVEGEGELPTEDYIPGLTIQPKPFKVVISSRE